MPETASFSRPIFRGRPLSLMNNSAHPAARLARPLRSASALHLTKKRFEAVVVLAGEGPARQESSTPPHASASHFNPPVPPSCVARANPSRPRRTSALGT